MDFRRLTPNDLPRLRQFWVEHWGGEEMVTRGNVYRPEQLEGFVIEDGDEWLGLLTHFIEDGECEITSLDSLREGQGIGTKLIKRNCRRSTKTELQTYLSHHYER